MMMDGDGDGSANSAVRSSGIINNLLVEDVVAGQWNV
jgi:hypothetical protein